MAKKLVLFHDECVDGFAAAWAAWRKYDDQAIYRAVKYGPGQVPPDVTGQDVLIVDFSYPREILLEMHAKAASLRVLDHHLSAEEDLRGLDFCLFDMNRSGAGITWDELHPGMARPDLINYVEDRDLWRWKLHESKAINAFIGTYEFNFIKWNELNSWLEGFGYRPSVIVSGDCVLRGVENYVTSMVKQVRTVSIHAGGERFDNIPCVNAPYNSISELLHRLVETSGAPFAIGWFQQADGTYKYSLRSDGRFDVAELAKKFGGGGHKSSAGFTRHARVDRGPEES